MSNWRYLTPSIFNCDFWIGNPGSMNNTVSLPGEHWLVTMNEPNDPATDPVVGIQASGVMSTFRKAFTKREVSRLSSGTPSAAG